MPDKAVKGVCGPAAIPDNECFEVRQAIRAATNIDLLTQIFSYTYRFRYFFFQIKALFCLNDFSLIPHLSFTCL